jgi:hypothetical protein
MDMSSQNDLHRAIQAMRTAVFVALARRLGLVVPSKALQTWLVVSADREVMTRLRQHNASLMGVLRRMWFFNVSRRPRFWHS